MPASQLVADSAVDLLLQLIAIPGRSGMERAVSAAVVGHLQAAGADPKWIQFDTAHKKTPLNGEIGNLILKLPGTVRGPRRLLMAHLDTVPLCVGCQPVRKGNLIVSKNPATALGGDNRGGCAAILLAAKLLLEQNLPHPPLTFLWTVQEEVGLFGARHVSVNKLGGPKLCFNWDGGAPEAAIIGATGDDHLEIEIHGLASHAGAAPEKGVSAIAIGSRAIHSLVEDGWFGLIRKGKNAGTSNVGVIHGGDATNVVTDRVFLKGEVRSHDPRFRAKIVAAYEKAFQQAARAVRNEAGQQGSVTFRATHKYESFRLDEREPAVQAALSAISSAGLSPVTRISNGGLDANWMNSHGLPTVTLGCGQSQIHTVKEELRVDQWLSACRIALALATGHG